MFTRSNRRGRANCDHRHSVTVRNSGIERTVCETCGHVSFQALEGLSGQADRGRFERQVETDRESMT